MTIIRLLLICTSLVAFAGCEAFSGDYWQQPSVLTRHGPMPPEEKRENQGGFSVLVGAPGQPDAGRVVADIEAFAQGRGFVRRSAESSYVLGNIQLDVTYRSSDLRVVAVLHSSRLSSGFADRFYQDFRRQYAGRYGPDTSIDEIDYVDNGSGPFAGAKGFH